MTEHIRALLDSMMPRRWFKRRNRRKLFGRQKLTPMPSGPSLLAMSMAEFNAPPRHGISSRRERI